MAFTHEVYNEVYNVTCNPCNHAIATLVASRLPLFTRSLPQVLVGLSQVYLIVHESDLFHKP